MRLHELKSAEGSRRVHNRVGHDAGSDNGKASARGQKSQKARSGGSVRPGSEGGRLPLFRRLPEQGFTSIDRREYTIVNLDQLNQFEDGTEATPALLAETGVVKDEKSSIKVLDNGSLDKKLTVKAHKFSASVVEVINARDGVHEVI